MITLSQINILASIKIYLRRLYVIEPKNAIEHNKAIVSRSRKKQNVLVGVYKNGDFEIRDSGDWKCVGNCGLEILGSGPNASNFALATISDRGFGGIDQKLDTSCFPAYTHNV